MAVYVDMARNRYRNMLMCHMIADTEEELHAMAESLGMRREWFQPRSSPHYDVPLDLRELAIQNGAVEVDRRQLVEIIRRIRTRRTP
jgi:hypothetical protein